MVISSTKTTEADCKVLLVIRDYDPLMSKFNATGFKKEILLISKKEILEFSITMESNSLKTIMFSQPV